MGKQAEYVSCGRASARGYGDAAKAYEKQAGAENPAGGEVNTFGGAYKWGKATGYSTRGDDMPIGQYHIKDAIPVTGDYCAYKVEKNLNLAFPHPGNVIQTSAHPASEPPHRRGLAVSKNSASNKGAKSNKQRQRDSMTGSRKSQCIPGESAKEPYGGAAELLKSGKMANSTDAMSPKSSPMMSHVNKGQNITAGAMNSPPDTPKSRAFRRRMRNDPSHGNPNHPLNQNKNGADTALDLTPMTPLNLEGKTPITKNNKVNGSNIRAQRAMAVPAGSIRHGHE